MKRGIMEISRIYFIFITYHLGLIFILSHKLTYLKEYNVYTIYLEDKSIKVVNYD